MMTSKVNKELFSKDYLDALEELGYVLRMNQCNDIIEVNGEPITEPVVAQINTRMRDLGFKQIGVLKDAYLAHAYQNSYHPIKDYLWKLEHDGHDYISDVASCVKDKHNVFGLWFRKWLIGSISKVCEDGVMNPMLVIDGKQDLGKSQLVRWLASGVHQRYFIESPINLDDKDDLVRLASTWIWEVAELGSTVRRTDRESLKHFLSRQQVTVRKPYDHYDTLKPSMASFIGTVNNESGILSDPTGSRRFLICNVTKIDWSYSDIDIGQVWAQAMQLYQDGERNRLTESEKELSRGINDEYEIDNPIQEMIEKYFEIDVDDYDIWTSSVDVFEHLKANGWKEGERSSHMALAAAMTKLGVRKTKRNNVLGRYVNGYVGIKPTSNLPR